MKSNYQTAVLTSLTVLAAVRGEVKAAVALNGTFGFVPIGNVTYSGSTLGQADSVSLPATELVNTVPANYNGSANDFYSGAAGIALLSHVSLEPSSLSLPTTWGNYVAVTDPNFLVISGGTSPVNRFDFNLVQLMKSSNDPSDLEIYGQGILHDTQGIFADTPGLLSIAFTQTGQTGAVNASFSVATSVVPEPGNLAAGFVAGGLILLGCIGYVRRA